MWGFTALVRDAELLSADAVRESAQLSSWLTSAESEFHIPAAVEAAKALAKGISGPLSVTLSGHAAADPTADSSRISVAVELPPAPSVQTLTTPTPDLVIAPAALPEVPAAAEPEAVAS